MSTNLIIMRKAAVAVKEETTAGTDAIAGTPASGDWLQADCEMALNPVLVENPAYTGSLDTAVASVGGFRPTLTLRVPFRGSGTAGTPPTLGRLLKACTMALTQTASAVGAPTAAASGTTTTITAASPFGTTADAYNGMPLLLAGDQTDTTGIVDYTAGGVISLGETLASGATTSTTLQIPVNDRYSPTSDESVYVSVTIYVFYDGIRYKFVGAQGTYSLDLTSGAGGMFTFTMSAQLDADPDNTALPSGAATAFAAMPVIPRWVNGSSQLNRKTARCRSLRLDFGVQTILPDNPEAEQGYDPALPLSRRISGTMDPYIDTGTNTALFTAMAAGTNVPIMAIVGATAGNRMLVMVPAARLLDLSPSNREGLGQFAIPFQADGPDAGAYITFF